MQVLRSLCWKQELRRPQFPGPISSPVPHWPFFDTRHLKSRNRIENIRGDQEVETMLNYSQNHEKQNIWKKIRVGLDMRNWFLIVNVGS